MLTPTAIAYLRRLTINRDAQLCANLSLLSLLQINDREVTDAQIERGMNAAALRMLNDMQTDELVNGLMADVFGTDPAQDKEG